MPVQIHGKQYITVAERLQEAKEELLSINTEVLYNEPQVVIKATIVTKKGSFTGISGANANKAIEKQSPYEVAETSAVGRALGFAGYGSVEGIATADEIVKSDPTEDWPNHDEHFCLIHNKPLKKREAPNGGNFYDHRWQDENKVWKQCDGKVTK